MLLNTLNKKSYKIFAFYQLNLYNQYTYFNNFVLNKITFIKNIYNKLIL